MFVGKLRKIVYLWAECDWLLLDVWIVTCLASYNAAGVLLNLTHCYSLILFVVCVGHLQTNVYN